MLFGSGSKVKFPNTARNRFRATVIRCYGAAVNSNTTALQHGSTPKTK